MSFSLPPFSSLLLRCCNVSWVPAIFFISFSSSLLCFPSCFSDVEMFHEFQPYSSFLSVPACYVFLPASLRCCNVSWVPAIFFISFRSGLLCFLPDVEMFHEFQSYSLFLSVPACSVFLPASQMFQCFMSSSHILHFFQFRPATISSLLLRWCNLSWVPAIFFVSFSSSLLRFPPCFLDVAMFHEFQPYSSFLSTPAYSVFLPVSQMLQCFMSPSNILYFF